MDGVLEDWPFVAVVIVRRALLRPQLRLQHRVAQALQPQDRVLVSAIDGLTLQVSKQTSAGDAVSHEKGVKA